MKGLLGALDHDWFPFISCQYEYIVLTSKVLLKSLRGENGKFLNQIQGKFISDVVSLSSWDRLMHLPFKPAGTRLVESDAVIFFHCPVTRGRYPPFLCKEAGKL